MIYDKLSNIKKYSFTNHGLTEAVSYLASQDLNKLEAGYKADFGNFRLMVNEYMSKPLEQAKYEMHRKAIDIHIILEGTEYIECTSADEVKINQPYDDANDCALGTSDNNCAMTLKNGWFLICFPQDAHLVGAHVKEPNKIKKCIVKINEE